MDNSDLLHEFLFFQYPRVSLMLVCLYCYTEFHRLGNCEQWKSIWFLVLDVEKPKSIVTESSKGLMLYTIW
jgi:hypothetical protein